MSDEKKPRKSRVILNPVERLKRKQEEMDAIRRQEVERARKCVAETVELFQRAVDALDPLERVGPANEARRLKGLAEKLAYYIVDSDAIPEGQDIEEDAEAADRVGD